MQVTTTSFRSLSPGPIAAAPLALLVVTLAAACGPPRSVSRVGPDPARSDARGSTDAIPADAGAPAADTTGAPLDAAADLALAGDGPPADADPPADAAPAAADVTLADAAPAADVSAADTLLAADAAPIDGPPDTAPDSVLDRPGPWVMVTHAPAGALTDLIGEVINGGFEIRVTGTSARPATLRLYVGAWNARARMIARLGEGGQPAYTDTSLSAAAPGQDRVYTILYRPAEPGAAGQSVQPLIVRWTLDNVSATYGNVTIQAATLTE
jgi:hypothetical protein